MTKFKMFFDKDKEIKWLNEMANEGMNATSFFAGVWNFEKCEPGEFLYQIDFGTKFGSVSDDYKEFMADNDIEIVQIWGFWIILRKKASLGEFQLYTDVDSQLEHYSKILKLFKAVTIFELICMLVQIYSASVSSSPAGWGFVLITFAIIIGFVNITIHTKDIINELTERKTGIATDKKKGVSPILPAGLLLNSVALISQDSISESLLTVIQVLAIIVMLIGFFATCKKRK